MHEMFICSYLAIVNIHLWYIHYIHQQIDMIESIHFYSVHFLILLFTIAWNKIFKEICILYIQLVLKIGEVFLLSLNKIEDINRKGRKTKKIHN